MTRLELLEMIGDVITSLDVARGSMLPSDPNRHQVDDLRALLDLRQQKLAQSIFNENTPQFKAAAEKVAKVGADIQKQIKDLDNLAKNLGEVSQFLDTVTGLVALALPFVA